MTASFEAAVRGFHDAPWVKDAVGHVSKKMESDGGHDAGHLLRVLATAWKIADAGETDVDRDVLVAAILFHDVVNLPKNHPERHLASTKSADHAADFFRGRGFDESQLQLLHEAIRCHSFSANLTPESLEAKIVSDADNMEAIGAFGIARTFYVGGLMRASIAHPYDPWAENRELDDLAYSLDHFFTKLLQLEERFYTGPGREIARERTEFLRDFLRQLRAEMA